MSRDLFVDTIATRRAPKRSAWTIAGSFIAHTGVLAALFVIPVLSALDNFVLHANDQLSFVMPAMIQPPTPEPPRAAAQPAAPVLNPTAAPLTAPDTTNVVNVPAGGSGSTGPGVFNVPVGGSGPGVPNGNGPVMLAAPPVSQGPVRPGGDIKPPTRILYVAPSYPTIAKATRIEGNVILEATIDEAGVVRDVRVLRSIPLLDRAAIEAVSQWRYTPTRLNGVAVPVLLTVTVVFTLK